MVNFHKKACYERAKLLLKQDSPESLRYACLELRQCIESIAYAKLTTYKKVVPEDKFNEWHPKRVFEFLLEMEPDADSDYVLNIRKEDSAGNPTKPVFSGEHRSLKLSDIKKIYNHLGYFLHTPTIAKQSDYPSEHQKLRSFIEDYIVQIEPVINTTFDMQLGNVVSFVCNECGQEVHHNFKTLKVGKWIKCLNQNCDMVYFVESIDGNMPIIKPLQVIISCDCGAKIFINYHKLKEGNYVICEDCKSKHFINREWVVRKEVTT